MYVSMLQNGCKGLQGKERIFTKTREAKLETCHYAEVWIGQITDPSRFCSPESGLCGLPFSEQSLEVEFSCRGKRVKLMPDSVGFRQNDSRCRWANRTMDEEHWGRPLEQPRTS